MERLRASSRFVNPSRRLWPARGLVQATWLLACALSAVPAGATDLAAATPPIEIIDHKLTSGPRTLWLPDGHWYLVDLRQDSVSSGASGATLADTATFVQVENGKFVLGGRLFILRADALAFGWNFSPCGSPEDIYLRDRAPNGRQPDCLTVYSRRGNRVGGGANFQPTQRALDWLAERHVSPPDYSVVITYARYATNTFGTLSLTIPADRFDSDAAAIAWSETLRTSLKRLFEHRDDEGHFPALPPSMTDVSPATAASRVSH